MPFTSRSTALKVKPDWGPVSIVAGLIFLFTDGAARRSTRRRRVPRMRARELGVSNRTAAGLPSWRSLIPA